MVLPSTNTSMYENSVLMVSELFTEHGNFIRAVIRSQVKNEDQTDDIYQDFFLSLVYRPIPKGVNNIKSYLYRAITNDIVDAVRKIGRYQDRIEKYSKQLTNSINNTNPENAFIKKEQLDKMFALIKGRVTNSESQAIDLRYRKHHSLKEAAEKMGVNDRSVSRYICVGLRKIRHFITIKRGNCNDSSQS